MGMGLEAAGMCCAWRVEWDRAAAGVIKHHDPDTPLFCDVVGFAAWLRRQRLKLSKNDYAELILKLRTLLLAGGSPCQDLSVAGLRKGLAGERSGLFRIMVRICRILQPRFVLWENVVGALSSNGGRDFAAVIGAFTGCIPEVPDDGWAGAGFARAATPDRWNVAWRVLDSQWFGVPQRRRRVFLVGSLGDGSCVEILFEPESVRGDHPPSRQTGEGIAGTLSSRAGAGGGLGTDFECSGGIQVTDLACDGRIAPTVTSKWAKSAGGPAGDECQNLVAQTLRGEGFDAREDGTGRGTPLVAFSAKDHGADVGEIAPTLRAMGHKGSHANAGGQLAVAFAYQQAGDTQLGLSDPGVPPVRAKSQLAANTAHGVRRLTPRECERLQGWPDDHTRFRVPVSLRNNTWSVDGAPVEQADGPRYKQCGNGVTRNVAEWIGRRIAAEIAHIDLGEAA